MKRRVTRMGRRSTRVAARPTARKTVVKSTRPGARRKTRRALTIYADEALFDVQAAIMYAMAPSWLSIESTLFGARVPGPPRITLCPDDGLHDVVATIPVEVTVLGTRHPIKLMIKGWLDVTDGVLTLKNFDIDVDTRSTLGEQILDGLIDRVLKKFQNERALIRLPEVDKIFGRDLDARVDDATIVEVHGRPYLCITAVAGDGVGEIVPAAMPLDLQANPPPEGVGRLTAIVPEEIINELIDALVDRYVHVIRTKVGDDVGLRLKGRIEVGEPWIDLQPGRIEAGLDVDIKRLKAGLRFFGSTEWQKIKLKEVDVRIATELQTDEDNRQAILHIRDCPGIKIKYKGSADWDQRLLKQGLKDIASTFNRTIRSRIVGRSFSIFTLPKVLFASDFPVDISVADGGLSIRDNAIVVDVHADPVNDEPITALAEYFDRQQLRSGLTHVVSRGSGQPVVFIPDLLGDLNLFQSQLAGFARWYRAVSYSWRGMGESEGGRWRYGFKRLLDDFSQLIDEIDVDEPIIVGQGVGAAIAAGFALRRPKAVSALVLVSGARGLFEPAFPVSWFQKEATGPAQGGFAQRFFGRRMPAVMNRLWSPEFVEAHPDFIARWKTRYLKSRVLPAINGSRAIRRTRITPAALAAADLPIAVVRGADDDRHLAAIDAMGAEQLVFDGASMMPMVEHAKAFNAVLKGFVDRHLERD